MDKVGVIGSGRFGTTIAQLVSANAEVLLYTRRNEVAHSINNANTHLGVELSPRIRATTDAQFLSQQCRIIFPVIPSAYFRNTMRTFYPYLTPKHLLIHGTKGFDLTDVDLDAEKITVSRSNVHTMSEVILEETPVLRVGCLSGPNLADEILAGQPTATVIASPYDEVIQQGVRLLSSSKFFVFASHDIIGAELAGALKNTIAIGSGILGGLNMGKNIQAMLITRGLREIIAFGTNMGASSRSFVGTAGIGDLIATATSKSSRNYQFGYHIGQGCDREQALAKLEEVAEGVKTLRIAHRLSEHYKIKVPISTMIYKVVYEDFPVNRVIQYLMKYPFSPDVDFL